MGGNFSIKASVCQSKPDEYNLYLFNENGLHFYCAETAHTFSQFCFDITNCGVTFNRDGSRFAVADFGGSVYIFAADEENATVPVYLSKVTVGMPVRSLAWCRG